MLSDHALTGRSSSSSSTAAGSSAGWLARLMDGNGHSVLTTWVVVAYRSCVPTGDAAWLAP